MYLQSIIKSVLSVAGFDAGRMNQGFAALSLRLALRENGLIDLIPRLRKIVPDISDQESSEKDIFNAYWELKRRAMHSFQCHLMLKALDYFNKVQLSVVDIGDSAGTHMLYLKELAKQKCDVDTLSVNIDKRAVDKIRARGLKAILCRAEDLNVEGQHIDLFTSFEMVEHLHNPAIFFRRLAKKGKCNRLLITVPYMKDSRVGLYYIRNKSDKTYFAGDEHIFELNPADWTLLMLHSGWKVIHSQISYQYPRKIPLIRQIFSWYWKKTDFEGFWGAILEKETTFSDKYMDWED
jgi:hypothetical protein